MQLVVKYSINLELQMRICQILPVVTSHLKQGKTFLNQLEELESQRDLTC